MNHCIAWSGTAFISIEISKSVYNFGHHCMSENKTVLIVSQMCITRSKEMFAPSKKIQPQESSEMAP